MTISYFRNKNNLHKLNEKCSKVFQNVANIWKEVGESMEVEFWKSSKHL